MLNLSIFVLEFENAIVIFEIHGLEFSYLPNLGLKKPYLCVLGHNFEKLFSYMKSAPSNLPNDNISWKNENA